MSGLLFLLGVCLPASYAMAGSPPSAQQTANRTAVINSINSTTQRSGTKLSDSSIGGLSIWLPFTTLFPTSWDIVQGRGKKDKGGNGMMMMMGGMMLMMGLSGLAALSGKALAASLAALMLAAMSLMKKGGGGGHHSTYEVVTVPHTGGHHHHRSLVDADDFNPTVYPQPTSYGTGYDRSEQTVSPAPRYPYLQPVGNQHHFNPPNDQ